METLQESLNSSSDLTLMETSVKARLSLLEIPPEVLLIILTILDAPDILNIRQTCRTLCESTYDRTIWVSLLQDQAKYLPLPLSVLQVCHADQHMQVYPTNFIEETVVKNRNIAKAWPQPRSTLPVKLRQETNRAPLMVLKLILERWLLAIYFDGVVCIYDVHSRDIVLRACLEPKALTFTSHAIAIDPSGERLTLALSHSLPPYVIDIYQLDISCLSSQPPSAKTGFSLVRTMAFPFYKAVKAIEPTRNLLILSPPSEAHLEIINWEEENGEEGAPLGQMFITDTNSEDVESLWNGVVAVRFFGSHILVFRTHSLEIYRYKDHSPNRPESPGYVLKHAFNMTFREVSFSDYSVTHNYLTEALIYEMDIFACDVIQGLFHYTVRLSVSSSTTSEMLPFLDVQLTSVYPLAQGVIEPLPTSVSAPDAPTGHPIGPMTYSANFSPSPSFTHIHIRDSQSSSTSQVKSAHRGSSRNPDDFSSRGFVSAQFLGPQGKRGMWVERKRTSTIREVQVWSRDAPSSSPFAGSALTCNSKRLLSSKQFRNSVAAGTSSFVSEMEGRVVYTLHSYDLRDDITMCTLGELSGTIALGHRSGEISIIEAEI